MIYYGSPAYFLYLFAGVLIVYFLYAFFKDKTRRAQDILIISLMGVNIFQHFFKSIVWPHLYGTGFGLINTAYNVCAFLILVSPLVFFSRNRFLKQFLTYFGTCGGIAALAVPFWFIGQTMFQWEFIRSWFCHVLLSTTSILPALFGRVNFRFSDGWKFAPAFFAMQGIILLDNVLCILAGFYPSGAGKTVMQCLIELNPLWMVRPPENFGFIEPLVRALSPSFLLDPYVPVLWCAIPVWLILTFLAYPVGLGFEALQIRLRRRVTNVNRTKNALKGGQNPFYERNLKKYALHC